MLSGAANIARGWPAIQVLSLATDRKVTAKSLPEIESDEVILAAVENPPRTGQTLPIAALLPNVLARYGLKTTEPAIDVSV